MPAIAVTGAQWGDEGKGKIVDLLSRKAQMAVRYSGGDNAGHTVVNDRGSFALHLVPCGIFNPDTTCIIGNGVALNIKNLFAEIATLNKSGVTTDNLFISDRAHVIMPYHLLMDGLEEEKRGESAIGTTRKGIGPLFSDKAARIGIRTCDLLDKKALMECLKWALPMKNDILTKIYGQKPLSLDDIYAQYCQYGEQLAPYIRDTSLMIEEALQKELVVLLEGAQGALLDPDFGTYPYTTSSSPLGANACLGSGIGPTRIEEVFGILKAYTTRVGGGPFPTELNDETGEKIRQIAHEYGATTGRPRRCGWFDSVAVRFAGRVGGFTGMLLTRLDILGAFPTIKICVAYELDGKKIDQFPASISTLERCKPVYEEMPGWMCPISDVRDYNKLPLNAKRYVARLEELVPYPIHLISVGPERDQTIFRKQIP